MSRGEYMSIELVQYDRDIYDDDAKLLLSVPIVSQRVYNQYWEQARQELGLYYLQDGAHFDGTKKIL